MGMLALMTAAVAAFGSTPVLATPPTLNSLYHLPVKDAAELALGPGPESFVERSPWNSIEPNYILNTVSQFGMSFYTRPERVASDLCAVTVGFVTFDTDPARDAPANEKAAIKAMRYDLKPLRSIKVERFRRYFIAGPAHPVPRVPGEKPAELSAAALTPNNCETPVSARGMIEAPSDALAIRAVTEFKAAVSAAQSRKRLPFRMTVLCDASLPSCSTDRTTLAGLEAESLRRVREAPCNILRPNADTCMILTVEDQRVSRWAAYWDITVMPGPSEHPREVHLELMRPRFVF
jgi:hypothetical protein